MDDKELEKKRSLLFTVLVLLMVGSVICGAISFLRWRSERSVHLEHISDMQAELEGLEEQIENSEFQESVGQGAYGREADDMERMDTAGVLVAGYQTAFYGFGQPETGDSEWSHLFDANVAKLKECFDEDYTGCSEWYFPAESTVDRMSWSFAGPYGLSEDGYDAVWLCRDSASNEVMAFTLAKWDPASQKFYDTVCYTTTSGYYQSAAANDLSSDEPEQDVFEVPETETESIEEIDVFEKEAAE